ncbi:MAG TPA: TonB-dependent receptor [Ferruginibacter sp.]|nr:TonB-dependent receptor [Ferruginibacter sp.]
MRKLTSYLVMFLIANILVMSAVAQNITISGNVKNSSTQENASAVSVTIKGASSGTFTDDKGNFTITTKSLPVTLIFSSIGFELQEVVVSTATQKLDVAFKPASSLGQEIVISASRVPERILESPVSIERVNASTIRNAPVANFYDVVTNLKGVDVTTSSLTFKTPTTRGFNSSGNTRFNQLVDGMDNQAPGLNFSVGAIIGLSELDVDNLELLSGASSALYGPGGMNGTLLMTSKNPFKYQGLSFLVKEGIMHTDKRQRDASAYHNWNLRWGKKLSDRWAFKVNLELIQAKDWQGTDYRNYNRAATGGSVKGGDRITDPNYDGINVYGDETTADIRTAVLNVIGGPTAAPFLKNFIDTLNGGRAINVSRTGYTEKEVTDPNTINYKMAGSLHYKINSNTEAVIAGYWGTGNTVYTGSERYSLKDFKMGQYKIEVNNKDWAFRAYTTQENAGSSYNTTVATRLFNESWRASDKGATPWYSIYGQTYLGGRLNGLNDSAAHALARQTADVGRPLASSAQFRKSYDSIRTMPISKGGALLLDKSDLYSVEGNYNLTKYTSSVADILVGANFRRFVLNSEGTLFADKPDSTIGINEYGVFAQATRKIIDRLKVTLSGRYDKNENFEGRFTPRATALVKIAENNNVRLSYQTAYRFPSTQQQWIDLAVGSNVRLLGGNKYFRSFYNFDGNAIYDFESLRKGEIVKITPADLKPESISSFEAGYKGLLLKDKLLVDVYGYFGQYQDFLGRQVMVQNKKGDPIVLADTSAGQRYSIPVNSPDKVKSYGFGVSFDLRLPMNFTTSLNFASDVLKDVPTNFVAYFNAPKYKVNASLGNTGFGPAKRLGFNVMYRWQQSVNYQGDFASGMLPDVHTLDAQVSVKLPKTKSIFKIGATNLLNQYYYNAIGNSSVGGLYYMSFGYNIY